MEKPTSSHGFVQVGYGKSTFALKEPVVGRVLWLEVSEDTELLSNVPYIADAVVVCRGETVPLMNAALEAGVKAVLTLEGEPHSPIGMRSHETGIPYILDATFPRASSGHNALPADGDCVRLDFSRAPLVGIELLE